MVESMAPSRNPITFFRYGDAGTGDVIVGKGVGKVSARNVLGGTVAQVEDGAVDSVVTLELSGGSPVVAVITKESVKSLGLKNGDSVSAIIKASHVMVSTTSSASFLE